MCLGNICRSPLAEGIFLDLLERRGLHDLFEVDSCGTGSWHIGERPDPRALAVAEKNGVRLPSRGRQFARGDDERFDLFVVMDSSNHQNVIAMGATEGKVRMMRSFDASGATNPSCALDVPDPYFGGPEGFDEVFEMLRRACEGLLDDLLAGPPSDPDADRS